MHLALCRLILLVTIAVLMPCCQVRSRAPGGNAAPKREDPVAVVAGQPIFERELLPLVQGQLRQIRSQEHEIRSQALENLIDEKVLEIEARRRGVTTEKLLEQEVDAKLVEPSDTDLKTFYVAQKDRLNRPLEDIKPQLAQALKQAERQQARQAYVAALREKADVSVLLRPPRVEVSHDAARVRGNPGAPVTIVEFSDFQCPYCRIVQPAVREVLAKYKGKVKLAYRDFPLREIHPQAQAAAEAARCAGDQQKFWEYHDMLLAGSSKLDNASLIDHARKLGLDAKKFETCLMSGKYKAGVEEDRQAGVEAGVGGTPAFFINGVLLSGAQPVSAIQRAVDAELASVRTALP